MPLTDTENKRAQPQAKSYRLADSVGLSLEVFLAGGKLFRWEYRFGRKEKLLALGKYTQDRWRLPGSDMQAAVNSSPLGSTQAQSGRARRLCERIW